MSVPEVARVFGKTGKAETATDSAPLETEKRPSSLSRRSSGGRA
ncbi:hypothetical protein ACNKHU_02980 [Shigella flexneri]